MRTGRLAAGLLWLAGTGVLGCDHHSPQDSQLRQLYSSMAGEVRPDVAPACEQAGDSPEDYRITIFVPLYRCACGISMTVTETGDRTVYEVRRGTGTREPDDDSRFVSDSRFELQHAYLREDGAWVEQDHDNPMFEGWEESFVGLIADYQGMIFRRTEECIDRLLTRSADAEERREFVRRHYGR